MAIPIESNLIAVLRAIAVSESEGQPVGYSRLAGLSGVDGDALATAVERLVADALIVYMGAPTEPTALNTPLPGGGYILLTKGRALLGIEDPGPAIF